jgi:hypothetical protein
MEHPLGTGGSHAPVNYFTVSDVRLVKADIGGYALQPPRCTALPNQQVDLGAFLEKAPGEVGADEPRAAGEEDASHG